MLEKLIPRQVEYSKDLETVSSGRPEAERESLQWESLGKLLLSFDLVPSTTYKIKLVGMTSRNSELIGSTPN